MYVLRRFNEISPKGGVCLPTFFQVFSHFKNRISFLTLGLLPAGH